MGNKWVLCNTVWYDGCDAWVAQFILPVGTNKEHMVEIEKCGYDGTCLLIEENYTISLENLIAMSVDTKYNTVIDRFNNMYF